MKKESVKQIAISKDFEKKGLLHQIKRVWKAFNIPSYEKGSFGKATGKGFKNQMWEGAHGYKKSMKMKHKSKIFKNG